MTSVFCDKYNPEFKTIICRVAVKDHFRAFGSGHIKWNEWNSCKQKLRHSFLLYSKVQWFIKNHLENLHEHLQVIVRQFFVLSSVWWLAEFLSNIYLLKVSLPQTSGEVIINIGRQRVHFSLLTWLDFWCNCTIENRANKRDRGAS